MPPQQHPRARHAAPKDPIRPRKVLLPGVLLAAAGIAFGGLAAFPASAADIAPRVTAASALQPVALPAPETVNLTLGSALEQGLKVANAPKPTPSPALEKASRDRDEDEDGSTVTAGVTNITGTAPSPAANAPAPRKSRGSASTTA